MKNINLNPRYYNVISNHRIEFDHEFNWDNNKILPYIKNRVILKEF